MKIEINEITSSDNVMIQLDIGNIPPNEVDAYVTKSMKPLKELFGCQIAVLPVRGGGWDFSIIRNANRKPVIPTKKKKKQVSV
jgi:hypothetical protein